MIELRLTLNYTYQWFSVDSNQPNGSIHVKGVAYDKHGRKLSGQDLIDYCKKALIEGNLSDTIRDLNGQFAVITILGSSTVMAFTDRLRSIPLFYSQKGGTIIIADDIRNFEDSRTPFQINCNAVTIMRSMGYTLGRETLIEGVFQLRPSECLNVDNEINIARYHRSFHSQHPALQSRAQWKLAMKELFFETGKTLSNRIGNRPVALPLSGGWDSRLIGLLLKLNGHKDVLCFTYGDPNHQEAVRSKEVAEKLGYPWKVIDYAPYIQEDYFQTQLFRYYVDYVGNGVSFPYIQEYFAARYLKEQYRLPEETIFIPGHSGDMLGGSHLLPDMENFQSISDFGRKTHRKSGRLIPLSSEKTHTLLRAIEASADSETLGYSHLLHDDWNIIERQSKQIVNSSKVWNFFGYEYLLPMWDAEWIEFFTALPFKHRVYKNLYDEVLEELFRENNLLLNGECASLFTRTRKQAYYKTKIKEYFPLLAKLKSNPYLFDFFYFKELLLPLSKTLPAFEYNEGNAILSAWYVQYLGKYGKSF